MNKFAMQELNQIQNALPEELLPALARVQNYIANLEACSIQDMQRNERNIDHCAKLDRTIAALEELLGDALLYEREAFDGTAEDLDVNGADLVDWFTQWREKVKDARMKLGLFF
jgi:hypothetical protein